MLWDGFLFVYAEGGGTLVLLIIVFPSTKMSNRVLHVEPLHRHHKHTITAGCDKRKPVVSGSVVPWGVFDRRALPAAHQS